MAVISSSCSSNAPGSAGRNCAYGLAAGWKLKSSEVGNGGGNTIGDGTLFRGLDTGLSEAAELTKGLGELAEEIGTAANGVGTPPGTGAAGATRMAGVLASLQEWILALVVRQRHTS